MAFKDLVVRYLTNNGTYKKGDPLYRKAALLNAVLLFFVGCCVGFFVADCFVSRMEGNARVSLVSAVASALMLWYFKATNRYAVSARMTSAMLVFCIAVYVSVTGNRHYDILWLAILPGIISILLKPREGRITLILVGIYILFLIFFSIGKWSDIHHDTRAAFNITGVVCCILFLNYFHRSITEDGIEQVRATIGKLEESREDLRLTVDSCTEAILGIDEEGLCVFCNDSCVRMLGVKDRQQILNRKIGELVCGLRGEHDLQSDEARDIIRALSDTKGVRGGEKLFYRADGTVFPAEYHSNPKIRDGRIVGNVITFMDITERKRRESEAEYLSLHDALTGLWNRRRIDRELAGMAREEYLPLSIIVGDVNWLKMTNDMFGHAAGDRLLRRAADVFRDACREGDTIARTGGDEFCALLPKTSEEEAERIMADIDRAMRQFRIGGMHYSLALGLATVWTQDQHPDELYMDAENKMYRHKLINRKRESEHLLQTLLKEYFEKYPVEKQHGEHVRDLSLRIGEAMGFSASQLKTLGQAAYLHDIGKLVLPEELMYKENCTEDERIRVQQHPLYGYRILGLFDETLDLAEYVCAHHERWDGDGYPKGLSGEEIPLCARIISAAEAYDRETRRLRMPLAGRAERAFRYVDSQSGTRFDPEVVSCLARVLGEWDEKASQEDEESEQGSA